MQECKIPQNITAEQNVLSAMLIGAKVIDKVAEILKPEDFYRPSHRIIYQVMLALHAKEQPVDLITVIEELKRRNKLDDVGGVNYVTLLGELAVTAANVEWHAKIVADEAVLRQVAEGCNEIASLACGGNGKSPREILGMMEQKVLGLTAQNHSNGPKQLRDAIGENMDAMSRQLERHETVTGLPTGFPQLDHLTGGLHPSDFIILAARPSMGKTSLGLNITENVALRGAKEGEAPKRVVLFSLEMSRNQLVKRMIRTEAEVGEEEFPINPTHRLPRRRRKRGRQVRMRELMDGRQVRMQARENGVPASPMRRLLRRSPKRMHKRWKCWIGYGPLRTNWPAPACSLTTRPA